MKTLKTLFSSLAIFGMAAGAQALVVFDITDKSEGSYVWNTGWTLGYSFEVEGSFTFNALGIFDVQTATPATGGGAASAVGLTSSHEVAVWDSVGNLLVSATVNPGDPTVASTNTYGNWVYQSIASTTLGTGTYRVGALYLANSDAVMVQQTMINNLGNVKYVQGLYYSGDTLTAPTGNFPSNENQYFGPTLLQVPDGGITLILLGLGLSGLAIGRRFLKA